MADSSLTPAPQTPSLRHADRREGRERRRTNPFHVAADGPERRADDRRKASPAEVDASLLLPRRLGRYHLFSHIGRGGMADIFLAQADAGLGGRRLVVIKEVLPALAHSPDFADMLVSEAKLASQLSHANVVKVEDLGREGETLFIAMEYVEGLDLREMLRRCAKNKVALPVEFSLRIVAEVLRGLSFAHRARGENGEKLGIVHRDVSPSNVLLSFEGEVKLCDFGIARANSLASALPDDAILGKAGYMSPEHARGQTLDARADVFAAGIILWELLAGRRLYKATPGKSLLSLARLGEIPELPERGLDDELDLYFIVQKALAKDREVRYPSAAAMLQDLEEYIAQARMYASPIRFGEWLLESFGQEVVQDRRARERVMRALSMGPAAVIRPIEEPRLPEYESTPSTFPVALREDPDAEPEEMPAVLQPKLASVPPPALAKPVVKPRAPRDEEPSLPPVAAAPREAALSIAPVAPLAPVVGPGKARFLALAILSMLALGMVWFLATR